MISGNSSKLIPRRVKNSVSPNSKGGPTKSDVSKALGALIPNSPIASAKQTPIVGRESTKTPSKSKITLIIFCLNSSRKHLFKFDGRQRIVFHSEFATQSSIWEN
jgi:hypothetical protein